MFNINVRCDYCGNYHPRTWATLRKENYCNKVCRSNAKHVEGNCTECNAPVRRLRCATPDPDNMFCNFKCFAAWNGRRMSAMNVELNPDRMRPETRYKLRQAHLGKGEGKAYPKIYSRHAHRVIAEHILGRPLAPGEVVHHRDENILNFHPSNLEVLPSQAEHARLHALKESPSQRAKRRKEAQNAGV